MIVADANLVVYLLVPGQRTAAAREWRAREPVWLLPPRWRSEVRNALLGYVRIGQLPLARAQQLMYLAERLLGRGERHVDSSQVLALAASSGLSAHDSEYAALAVAEHVRLVSADTRVCEALPDIAAPL